jgi:hypothetical protein
LKLKRDLVCLRIVVRGLCSRDERIVEHHADEKGEEQPAQWTDFPASVHATALGIPIRCACASLRRDFQHRGQ